MVRGVLSLLIGIPFVIKFVVMPAIGGVIATAALTTPVDLVSRVVLLNRALAFDRCNVDVLNHLGNTHVSLGHYPEAAASFEKAVVCAPERADIQLKYGVALYGSKVNGYAAVMEAKRLEPFNPVIRAVLGNR